MAQNTAPFFSEAQPGLPPAGFAKKGDTCLVEHVTVDSAGTAWFSLRRGTSTIWSPASNWHYVSAEITADESAAGQQSDEDRKRRLRAMRDHADWPRRILRAVRDGKVVLDMTGEQLAASWGDPDQKTPCFTLGMGNHETWFYLDAKRHVFVVVLQNDRVMGWNVAQRQ